MIKIETKMLGDNMSEQTVYPVSQAQREKTLLTKEQYEVMYKQSIESPDEFWAQQAQRLKWIKPFNKVKDVSFDKEDLHIRWFEDGVLNVSENCVDRHLDKHGDDLAIIWESDDENVAERNITYNELSSEVNRLANGLKSLGIKKGDIVTLYLPMVPEATVAMLACARIGAVHSVVFAGFSPEALAGRIEGCDCRYVITADEGLRAGKHVSLKKNVDEAIELCPEEQVNNVIVLTHTGGNIERQVGRDVDYKELISQQSEVSPPEPMNAEDPLFILYTSGSTGKPKGVLHTTGGYLLYAAMTHEYVFDYRPGDIYWCAADVGWITGHSYIVYGPLCNAATIVMFEGVPNYPDAGRAARIIEKHKINILYVAPTALRAIMAEGPMATEHSDLSSLRLLGTVGEPISPDVWRWYHKTFGRSECPIVDTWWQTETGAAMISPLPGATDLKPGSATLPMFGVQPGLVDENGIELEGAIHGNLIIKDSWPGQMRTVFGDHQRFYDTYFSTFQGSYCTGDGARRDEDGYYWLTGRVDDVLNVSGHRMGTAEIEHALVDHAAVAEAAVIGIPHDIKGQGIYVYVTLGKGFNASEELRKELVQWVRKEIGPIATPDLLQWAPGLPKTRSGKIMRRILRKIATDELDTIGDISTLADPDVVADLIVAHKELHPTLA
jgi:acetyl-CoA synthetase